MGMFNFKIVTFSMIWEKIWIIDEGIGFII